MGEGRLYGEWLHASPWKVGRGKRTNNVDTSKSCAKVLFKDEVVDSAREEEEVTRMVEMLKNISFGEKGYGKGGVSQGDDFSSSENKVASQNSPNVSVSSSSDQARTGGLTNSVYGEMVVESGGEKGERKIFKAKRVGRGKGGTSVLLSDTILGCERKKLGKRTIDNLGVEVENVQLKRLRGDGNSPTYRMEVAVADMDQHREQQ